MIAAIVLGLLIGLALGSLGGGGSILAVPVLAHLAGQSAAAATATALVAVGVSAAVGSMGHARAGNVRWGAAGAFVVTGVAGSWLGTRLNGQLDGDVLLLAFSGLVLVAAHRMLFACPTCTKVGEERAISAAGEHGDQLDPTGGEPSGTALADRDDRSSLSPDHRAPGGRGLATTTVGDPLAVEVGADVRLDRPADARSVVTEVAHPDPSTDTAPALPEWATPAAVGRDASDRTRAVAKVVAAGTVVGLLTGLFGVGGGFVIVPALTLALGLNMPKAIGTSLVIIVGNAAVALAFRGVGAVDWGVAIGFSATMLVGSLAGSMVAHRLPAEKTLRAFAGLLVAVAIANAAAAATAIWG
jgi:uncharacterized membrane protein YfcA